MELKVAEYGLFLDNVRINVVISHHNSENIRIIRNRSGRVVQKYN
jgi:hypothetical protein